MKSVHTAYNLDEAKSILTHGRLKHFILGWKPDTGELFELGQIKAPSVFMFKKVNGFLHVIKRLITVVVCHEGGSYPPQASYGL